jgi:hypothetical protein
MKFRAWSVMMGLLLLAGLGTAGANGADVVPAGTVLNVRTIHPIVIYSTHVGMRFRAIVDDPVMDARGYVVVPRGSLATLEAVDVQQSSNLKGRDRITLRVLSLHVGDRGYYITSSSIELKGHSEGNARRGRSAPAQESARSSAGCWGAAQARSVVRLRAAPPARS